IFDTGRENSDPHLTSPRYRHGGVDHLQPFGSTEAPDANNPVARLAHGPPPCNSWCSTLPKLSSHQIVSLTKINARPRTECLDSNMRTSRQDPAERSGYLRFFYRNWRPTRLGRIWSAVFAWVAGLGLTPQILLTLQVRNRNSGRLSSTVLVGASHQGARYV